MTCIDSSSSLVMLITWSGRVGSGGDQARSRHRSAGQLRSWYEFAGTGSLQLRLAVHSAVFPNNDVTRVEKIP